MLGLHGLELVESGVQGVEIDLALSILASLHSSSHLLLEGSDVSLSCLVDSSHHDLASLLHLNHSCLVCDSGLLVEFLGSRREVFLGLDSG